MPPNMVGVPSGHAIANSMQANLAIPNSVTALTVPAGCSFAVIQVLSQPISLTEDGTTPTAANGFLLNAGDIAICFEPAAVKMIRQGGTNAAVQVGYYN